MKILLMILPLSLMLSGCVREYEQNQLYAKGLNNGRIYDKNEILVEKEAVEFNRDRTTMLDEYFDTRASEILKRK